MSNDIASKVDEAFLWIGGISVFLLAGITATMVYFVVRYRRREGASAEPSPSHNLPLELTIVHADVHTLIRNNLADDRDAQARIYATLIDRLKAAGADCAAITSLGGHFCFDETVALSSLPLVSGVAPLDAHFARQGIKRVGLLGTRVVMKTRLYGQLHD